MNRHATAPGFTLVELVIGIALFTTLLVIAVPSMMELIQNSRVRGSADGIAAGLQLARSEAIRRNAEVHFALVANDPAEIVNGSPAWCSGPDGNHWAVWVESRAEDGTVTRELIDSRAAQEGGGSGVRVSCAQVAGGTGRAGEIVFDSLGVAKQAATVRFEVTAAVGACRPDGFVRCLDVAVTAGGAVRVCDPTVRGDVDNRRCPL
jgi:type IV fimbrial biogenesis protein FimT